MTRERREQDRERTSGPGEEAPAAREAPAAGQARVPEPSPEEVPELLGERSDYPVPFGEEER